MRLSAIRALAAPVVRIRFRGAVWAVPIPSTRAFLLALEEPDVMRQCEMLAPVLPWRNMADIERQVASAAVLHALTVPSLPVSKDEPKGDSITATQMVTYYGMQTHTSVPHILDMPWTAYQQACNDLTAIRRLEMKEVEKTEGTTGKGSQRMVQSDGDGNVTVHAMQTSSGPRMAKEAALALKALGIRGIPASQARAMNQK